MKIQNFDTFYINEILFGTCDPQTYLNEGFRCVTGGYFTNTNEATGHVTFILNVIIQYIVTFCSCP